VDDGIDGTIGIPAVPHGTENSRNSVPNHSSEEKNAWNSVLWNKNRSKFSEFRSEPFCRGEKRLDFCTAEQK
jgi:hypothetical protein